MQSSSCIDTMNRAIDKHASESKKNICSPVLVLIQWVEQWTSIEESRKPRNFIEFAALVDKAIQASAARFFWFFWKASFGQMHRQQVFGGNIISAFNSVIGTIWTFAQLLLLPSIFWTLLARDLLLSFHHQVNLLCIDLNRNFLPG